MQTQTQERQPNSSFSQHNPNIQIAWDSTSIGAFKTCPRYYQLSIVEGWRPRGLSVHLEFGLHFHKALEMYDHQKALGKTHREAQLSAVRCAMEITWDYNLNRPWISDDPNKNRWTLVRSISWYLEHFHDDPLQTIILANGKPAVELSFRFELDFSSAVTGENYLLCGHIDRMAEMDSHTYIVDRKTSKHLINERFFAQFSPNNQMSTYTFAAQVYYSTKVSGIIIDGAQIAQTFTRFQRGPCARTQEQLDEWYRDLKYWISMAEFCATTNYWPMNETSCGNYEGCQYRGICGRAPQVRDQWLKAGFTRRVWDPLQVRGDV